MLLYEKALAKEKALEKEVLPEPKTLVCSNSKSDQSFRGLLRHCSGRTEICSKHCYACYGHIAMPQSVKRAIAIRRWIEKNGSDKAAERMATEIKYKGTFRWMDRGDFDDLTVDLANRVVELRPDVKFCAYTRNSEAAAHLCKGISVVFSLDASSTVPRFAECFPFTYSWLKTSNDDKIPKWVDVVHPLNKRKALIGDPRDCTFARHKTATCRSCMRCFSPRQ